MKIAIGQLAHETNTFSTILTKEESFKDWEWALGDELINKNKGVKDYLGGMIAQSEELQIELIPIFSAAALPSGKIEYQTYQIIKEHFLENFPSPGEYDGICLALHGAGVVETIDDLEGDFLEFIRNIVGDHIPIIATLDLHGNITEKMVQHADLLLGVHLYPHTDSYDRGKEAIIRMKQLIEKEIKPEMHFEKLPLLIPTFTSSLYPITKINELCWEFEENQKILDCTFFHGFPYTDVAFAGASIITITDGDKQLASTTAKTIADIAWELREAFFLSALSPLEGIQKALESPHSMIVLNETADNPGAGTPCDGTHLLKAMLESNLENACMGMVFDPEVVELAHRQGVGTEIEIFLGGKTDGLHGEPVFIKGYVKTLSDGIFYQTSPMWYGREVNIKKSVRIQVGGLDIIVGSLRTQVFDEQIFLIHGIDVRQRKIIGLKSSQHFRAFYEGLANEIIPVDSPGLSSLQLNRFEYINISRPIYPLDKNIHLEKTEYSINDEINMRR